MGSNPTLGRYFSTQVYINGDEDGIRRGVMPRSRQFLSTTLYPFKDKEGRSVVIAGFYTRSPVSWAGRASDLQAEGCGFEPYTG